MTAIENQIVVYQPNETVRLDVRLENETVWRTRLKIADGVTLTLPSNRFIYSSGALDVRPGAGAKFIVSGAAHGPAPAWLTIYGRPAKYKANGELAIANRGFVVSFR